MMRVNTILAKLNDRNLVLISSHICYEIVLTPHSVTGGYHDIVSFDPRLVSPQSISTYHKLTIFSGVGSTIMFECFDTPTERALAFGPFQGLANSSDTALGSLEASAVYIAETCYEKNREYGEMLGTAFVARDMLRIAEAIDDDGLLRYWGEFRSWFASFPLFSRFSSLIRSIDRLRDCISSL